MTILFLLVPVALLLVFLFLLAFVWSAKRGQWDDLVTPAVRMLNDDALEPNSSTEDQTNAPSHSTEPVEHSRDEALSRTEHRKGQPEPQRPTHTPRTVGPSRTQSSRQS